MPFRGSFVVRFGEIFKKISCRFSWIVSSSQRFRVLTFVRDLARARRDLKFVLGPSRPVSFSRCASRPPIEFDTRIWTQSQINRTEKTWRWTIAGTTGMTRANATLIVSLVTISATLQLSLEAMKLLHEVEIGSDVGFTASYEIECIVQAEAAFMHEVGDSYRYRTRYACETMHQNTLVRASRFLCKIHKNLTFQKVEGNRNTATCTH